MDFFLELGDILGDEPWLFLFNLAFLVFVARAWSSLPFSFYSLFIILPYSCTHYSHGLLNLVNFLIAYIPLMKESHSLERPFRVVITTSSSSTISPMASNCSLIRDTLEKYDCMVSSFCIFTHLSCFLKVILLLMFLLSNRLVGALNISFRVFFKDTRGIKWSLIESFMILLDLVISFLCLDFSSSPFGSLTSSLLYPSRSCFSRRKQQERQRKKKLQR